MSKPKFSGNPSTFLCLQVISIVGTMMHREDDSELSADEEEVDEDEKDKVPVSLYFLLCLLACPRLPYY